MRCHQPSDGHPDRTDQPNIAVAYSIPFGTRGPIQCVRPALPQGGDGEVLDFGFRFTPLKFYLPKKADLHGAVEELAI